MFEVVGWAYRVLWAVLAVLVLYLLRVNQLLSQTPDEVRQLSGSRWTIDQLNETYRRLQERPIDYTTKIPPKLERRYIVTGGSGLVGGFVVLQLLARGNLPESIRIIDIRKTERNDMRSRPATEVEFVKTDITSSDSVDAAFARPWNPSVAHLPLTVFHTAAVILASERSKFQYAFPEAVNVIGTKNVLAAARRAGADIFSSTSSGSISIRPVEPFVFPWASSPRNFWQVLDVDDFNAPLREREEYFANYPASKAIAERFVCDSNDEKFRTGCIRPANGVYGHPTDNTVGDPLGRTVLPSWVSHIVQSFVHGANVSIAHLQHEAALARPWIESSRQAGRPFVVTDPNPPITYSDLYHAIETLSVHPFRVIKVPPVVMLLLSHAVEMYAELPYKYPLLRKVLPELKSDIKHLKPGIFSICTHLIASNDEIGKPVSQGGLGYTGVLTTLEGMALEILEWNKEHVDDVKMRKAYTTSVSLAEQIREHWLVRGGSISSWQ
ncbi:NAD(P)-binding protein [Daldinia vernicosa]|uniref:NAD(P)-binding protein n=1 Tax=Daldinia vernicosa TaxID=114800 RepID=UPI002007D55B|nr:NAD(P)-binding protein [Daldinia vernicosa]KAI0845004.1 NAD(P)-binding protein [Daldinia vernicosa]